MTAGPIGGAGRECLEFGGPLRAIDDPKQTLEALVLARYVRKHVGAGRDAVGVFGKATVLSALIACLAIQGWASAEGSNERVEILSIRDIRLAADEYIDAFAIRTQGVEILAACRVPFGWHVSLGDYDAVEGDLKGQAGVGASFINNGDLDRLNGLFLVRVEDFTDKWNGSLPPTYRLSVHVGRYGHSGDQGRRLSLPLKNLDRVPARACPPPALG